MEDLSQGLWEVLLDGQGQGWAKCWRPNPDPVPDGLSENRPSTHRVVLPTSSKQGL